MDSLLMLQLSPRSTTSSFHPAWMPQFSFRNELPSPNSTELLFQAAMMPASESTTQTPSPRDTPVLPSTGFGNRKKSPLPKPRVVKMASATSSPAVATASSKDDIIYAAESVLGSQSDMQRSLSLTPSDGPDHAMVGQTESERDTENQNPRKRGSNDMPDYPRRRATIACEICRGRKSRCDGAKPRCRLCSELGAECVYREPGIKLDAGDKLILERLSRIEGLLQQSNIAKPPKPAVDQSKDAAACIQSPALSNTTHGSKEERIVSEAVDPRFQTPVVGLGAWQNDESLTNISTMPKVHTTPALHLLQWPIIRDLVSRPYDPQHLLQLELSREPLQVGNTLSLDLANTDLCVQAFFQQVNVWYACVNPYDWHNTYREALSNGFREGPESCITLLVLALGAASMAGSISNVPPEKEPPGMPYFSAAWALIPGLMTRNNVLSAQCMILASAYLFYLVRPLEAWTLLSSNSMKLQLLLGRQGRIPSYAKELSERVYWNSLMFESDLLAELDLPHSGIVQFEELVGLPSGFEEVIDGGEQPQWEQPPQAQPQQGQTQIQQKHLAGLEQLWYFLAEIALRRLLNRVSSTIYSQKGSASMSLASLQPVVEELDFQLTQWYEGLPQALQFPYSRVPVSNPVQTVLRLRYFACRTIIFRPYILAVLENETAIFDRSVRENCHKCLEAAVRQLEHVTAHHAGHLPYLWQGTLSIVSQTLLVLGATACPSLAALLPPAEQMDAIIEEVVREVDRYKHLAPSLRLSAEIVREAEERRMLLLRATGLRP